MRLIDADALIAEWYKLNNIGPEDCGARFVGYQEIARLINNAPTVSGQGDYISRADAIKTVIRMCAPICDNKNDVIKAIEALPSAEAADVYKAHEEEHLEIINRIKELQYAIAKTQTIVGKVVESADAEKTYIGIDIPYGSDKGIATIFKRKDDKLILEEVKELIGEDGEE